MSDLYLHIGTEKTGTTSIQRFLRANRPMLAESGVLYSVAAGKQNHAALTVAALEAERVKGDLRKLFHVQKPEDVEQFREALKRDLDKELRGSPYPKVVMSGEHCSSRLISEPEVGWLKALLAPYFKRIYIVVYLRRQDDYLLSTYSTAVKGGSTKTLGLPNKKRTHFRYDHWDLVSRWANVFGRDNIICRKFERASLKNGDVIADFLDAVDIDPDLPFEHPPTANESFDASTLEFLRLFNGHVPRFTEEGFNPARDSLVKVLTSHANGPLLTLSEEDLREFMSQFEETNRKVAEEYFGGALKGSDDPLFLPRSDTRERTSEPNLTAERAVEIAAWLWQQKQSELEALGEQAKPDGKPLRPKRRRGKSKWKNKSRQLADEAAH